MWLSSRTWWGISVLWRWMSRCPSWVRIFFFLIYFFSILAGDWWRRIMVDKIIWISIEIRDPSSLRIGLRTKNCPRLVLGWKLKMVEKYDEILNTLKFRCFYKYMISRFIELYKYKWYVGHYRMTCCLWHNLLQDKKFLLFEIIQDSNQDKIEIHYCSDLVFGTRSQLIILTNHISLLNLIKNRDALV